MTAIPVIHAYDWSIKTGVAVALRRPETGQIATRHLRPIAPPKAAAGRLWHLYQLTCEAARWAHHVAPMPQAAYWEQAFGSNMRMLQAAGVVQAGLWEIGRGSPFPPNVWPYRTTEWRQKLGLVTPVVPAGSNLTTVAAKKLKRHLRKVQQRDYALQRGHVSENISEDEADAVCILLAAELDMTSAERTAA